MIDEVYLSYTPQTFLDNLEPKEQSSFLLPGYGLPGMGIVNSCLHYKPVSESLDFPVVQEMFFNTVTSFRLIAPLHIHVSSSCTISSEKSVRNMNLYSMRSPYNPLANSFYTGVSLHLSKNVLNRIPQIRDLSPTKIFNAYRFFQHVTCGYGRSLQMVYLTLWSILEFILQPSIGKHKNYAANIARRIGPFLDGFDNSSEVSELIVKDYKENRHKRIHGLTAITQNSMMKGYRGDDEIPSAAEAVIGILHEVVRLSLLKLFSLPDELIIEHSAIKSKNVDDWFEKIDERDNKYCLNMRSFTDKRTLMSENIRKIGIEFSG